MADPTTDASEREISRFVERLNADRCDGIDCPYHGGQRAIVAEIIAATWRAAAEIIHEAECAPEIAEEFRRRADAVEKGGEG